MVVSTEPSAPAAADTKSSAERGHGPSASKFSIRMDIVNAATAELPERERTALRWIAGYCASTNQSHRDIAPKLRQSNGDSYSHDSLYHALTGGRGVDQLANIVGAIERFRKIIEERASVVQAGFIETAISRKIWKNCRKALRRRRVLFIYGQSQIGKTISIEAYASKHNHGETKLVRLPVGGGFTVFLRLLAEACHVPIYQTEIALRDAIMEAVDENMLLIVDEMHEAFGPDGRCKLGVKIVNFLREIYDRRKCGLVLVGTKVFSDALNLGPFAKNMQQILRRGLPPLQLPAVPTPADLALFAEKYGLGAASDKPMGVRVTWNDDHGRERTETLEKVPLELQTEVVAQAGLGRWVMILEEASDLAHEKKRPITWGMVIHAWDSFQRDATFAEEDAPS